MRVWDRESCALGGENFVLSAGRLRGRLGRRRGSQDVLRDVAHDVGDLC